MKRSSNTHIRTTHTGSLPRPDSILEAVRAQFEKTGRPDPRGTQEYEDNLRQSVFDIVDIQAKAGLDTVGDGECSKPSFRGYLSQRLAGFEPRIPADGIPVPGPVTANSADAKLFPDYYEGVKKNNPFANTIRVAPRVCIEKIEYVGHADLARDIKNLQDAMAQHQCDEGFMPAAGPIPVDGNEFYNSESEYFEAYANGMREEYKAIINSGLLLQIDDPRMVSSWDARGSMDLKAYREGMVRRIEYINHALRDLPVDRIRFHTCYGVNFGPRVTDLQLEQVLDLLLTISAGSISFEASNPRHDHEWRAVKGLDLQGKVLIPGAITHSNVTIEHPQIVADRMDKWIQAAGAENLLFGNDCGFASTAGNCEIPTTVAWAKLQALGSGARLASTRH
jgi:5-methyltetrahydropteroyltriglutamate--homocysteine methyltransferase